LPVTAFWYGLAFTQAFNKEISITEANKLYVALAASTYTPAQDTDNYWNDVQANEAAGVGYTANGASIAGASVLYTAGTNTWYFDATDVTWATSTITARYAVVYYSTGTASTSALLLYQDFGANQSSSAGNFTLAWSASGLGKIVAA
jgi:hypothetical protein